MSMIIIMNELQWFNYWYAVKRSYWVTILTRTQLHITQSWSRGIISSGSKLQHDIGWSFKITHKIFLSTVCIIHFQYHHFHQTHKLACRCKVSYSWKLYYPNQNTKLTKMYFDYLTSGYLTKFTNPQPRQVLQVNEVAKQILKHS